MIAKNRKYLVRDMRIERGENIEMFSLHYVNFTDKEIIIFPFQREQAGYEYLDKLLITKEESKRYKIIIDDNN